MKKIAVIYQSHYGSTRQYAEWIAQDLGADLYVCNEVKPTDLEAYDCLIFGGGLYAGGMIGSHLLKDNYTKLQSKVIVTFSVGLAPDSDENQANVRKANFSPEMKNIPLFMLRGSYEHKKASFKHRSMMKMLAFSLSRKKKPLSSSDQGLIDVVKHGGNFMDRTSIEPLVSYVKNQTR